MLRLRPLFALLGVPTAAALAQTPSATNAIPNQSISTTSAPAEIDLGQHFTYTGVTGSIARFETVLGDFDVELLDAIAPKHVENFKAYANDGPSTTETVTNEDGTQSTVRHVRNYDNSFIHRSSSLELTDAGAPDISKPAKVLQGGSFKIDDDGIRKQIRAKDSVELEYKEPNARGTLAAARGSAVNSANSGWFFNLADNSTALGQTNGQGGYTVFGKVLGSGLEVLDALGALPRFHYSESFGEFPLRNYTSGPVKDEHLALLERVRVLPIQPAADGSTPGVLIYSVTTSSSGIVEPKLIGRTLQLTPRAPGTATITVSARDARNNSVNSSFTVAVTAGGPVITTPPVSQTVPPGGTATFSVAATGAGTLAYQWRKNGVDIPGATQATLTLANLSAGDAGNYTVAVTNSLGTTVSRAATLIVAQPSAGGLANLSVRGHGQQFIVGFVAEGGSQNVLLRAVGPTLNASYGLSGAMADPQVSLGGSSNNDWGSDSREALQAAFSKVGAFPFSADDSKDAALIASVSGVNTALITPASGGAGIVLAEVYTLREGAGRLVNVSARANVGREANVLIAGFVIDGNVPRRVLIRAVGPTLGTKYDVPNVLANPVLELYRTVNGQNELIATNDDWGTDDEVVNGPAIGFPLDAGSADSAWLVTLAPGVYSARVRGVAEATGEALVEVYEGP